jgi:hypothetical protein
MDSLQRQPAKIIDKTNVYSAYVYGRKYLIMQLLTKYSQNHEKQIQGFGGIWKACSKCL